METRTNELGIKNELLQRSNATKDKFLSIIAHDLRNPFTSLLGFGQLLETNFDSYDQDQIKNKIYLMNTTARQTYDLLENLLKWANSQRGELPFKPEKIDLYEFVKNVTHLLEKQAIHKRITINTEISEDIRISVDKNMFSTILRNLISNAVKFTQNNGLVLIKAKTTTDNDCIEISVNDSGIGIPNDKINNLFKIEKITATLGTNQEQGSGLGLILCKDFINAHNGKLTVKSEVGKGSSFKFTIPFK